MRAQWLLLKTRYESLIPRERLLLVGAFVAVVYLLWDFIVFQPLAKEEKILSARERNALQTIKTSEAEIQVLSGLAKKDPSVVAKNEIELLSKKLADLDAELSTLALGLIPAEQLPIMLHDVLKSNQKLKLIKLVTLPVEPVLLTVGTEKTEESAAEEKASSTNENSSNAKLYRHGVELEFKGGYLSAVQYLNVLETGKWKFYWDSFSYSVVGYPDADVRLKVFTLSGDKGVFDG